MKRCLFLTLVLSVFLSACSKDGSSGSVPKCVKKKIENFSKQYPAENGANVKKFKFQENTVYVFDPGPVGADLTSEVIDGDCNTLGFLGGITGNTVIMGADFSEAEYIQTVWGK